MITISVLQTLLKALLYAGVVAGDELVDYSEYKVVRMRNLTELRSAKLAQFLAREKKVQMWEPDYPSQVQQTKSADFLIEEKRLLRLREQFAPNEFEILIDDVEAAINEQKRQPTNINSMESMPYDIFLTYPQAERWLRETADKFPEMAQLKHLAKTEQGRDLWGLQIGKHAGNSDKRIFVDCGFHAREWIAPASCRYFINLALSAAYGLPVDTSSGSSIQTQRDTHLPFTAEDVASLLDIDWFIMPFANPDGYEWTWIADRMWRKNRADYGGTCKGIDLNRNFPVGHRTGMGTTVECMITYADTTPISQPETKAWDSWIRELHEEKPVSAQISVHTYSQLLMPPWATGRDEGGLFASDPPNSVETRLLATFCILMSHSLTVIAAIINFRVKM
ncbi:unnamed protein product [Oikopleura dioica]|uniref:Peptidase M14 domain-containing protein n=1 Tax=Oikopleura dioica TaxID=34765 RepID=E4XC18_OIKDI|nr:unnamed protein product [Oikopleura dioica]